MQQDKLRDFLKFFRFHLPWFVLSAGFFAVILLTGLFISSRLSQEGLDGNQARDEQLAVVTPEQLNDDELVIEEPSEAILPIAPATPAPSVLPVPAATPTPTPQPTAIPSPAPQAAPTTDNAKEYIVKAGDTLWDISVKQYGSGYDYSRISRANALANANQLTIGQKLILPEQVGEIASGVSVDHGDDTGKTTSTSYRIVNGDSLWKIAEQELGDPYRWVELYQLNKAAIGSNPDLIYPDVVLQLPSSTETTGTSSQTQPSNWTSSLLQ